MTSFKLSKDFTGDDIYCNRLNVYTLVGGPSLNIGGDVTVQGNLSVTGNTSATTITSQIGASCGGGINARANTLICSGGGRAATPLNTLAFFNGLGRPQGRPVVEAIVQLPDGAGDPASATTIDALTNIVNELVGYGLLA